jgi:hypothetical protein
VSEETKTAEAEGVLGIVNLCLTPAYLVWSGFVLSKLWLWFMVPHGLPALSIPMAAGIGVTLTFATQQNVVTPKNSVIFAREVAGPAMALLVGYVLRSFL